MTASFDYDLSAQLNDGTEVKLNPEEHGWAEPERLSKVKVWSILPRVDGLPIVTVQIPEGAKPIFKSRVYGKGYPGTNDSTGLPIFRAYAVGWHDTSSHWTWVLPGGVIEIGEDPIHADMILQGMMAQHKAKNA
jgi:hypothetical protein